MNELDIYQHQGWGNRIGFGKAPALLVIDFVNGFTDPAQFGGGNITAAIERTQVLLRRCRELKLPVVFTRVVYAADRSDAGVFCLKAPSLTSLTEEASASQVVASLTPRDGEYVLRKTQASSFFGTNLASWLTLHGVDTLLIAGCTTSGCVRATVVDAIAYNYRPMVISDCVGDRALEPHQANLFDMGQKYADVLPLGEVLDYLSGEQPGAG